MVEISQRYICFVKALPSRAVCYESTGDPRAEPRQHCMQQGPTLAPTALLVLSRLQNAKTAH